MQISHESESFHTKKAMLQHNIRKISLISKITSAILLFIITTQLFMQVLGPEVYTTEMTYTIIPYLLLIIFNIVCFYFTDISKIRIKNEFIHKTEKIITGYIVIIFGFGAVISLIDTFLYNPLLMYSIITLVCSSFFVLRKNQLLVPLLIMGGALCIGLYMKNGFGEIFIAQFIYIGTIMAFSYLLSRSLHRSFTLSSRVQADLLREIEFGRKISRELREANRKLGLQASHDPLTKLFNRRAFNEYIDNLELRTDSGPFSLTAVMMDVDCFKLYNDYYGHSQGDLVLKEIANVLSEIAEHYGIFAARWGGEEFSLLIVNESETKVRYICEEIIHAVHMLKMEHAASLVDKIVTVSIGARSDFIVSAKQILCCVEEADAALYEVKENGRNAYLLKSVV